MCKGWAALGGRSVIYLTHLDWTCMYIFFLILFFCDDKYFFSEKTYLNIAGSHGAVPFRGCGKAQPVAAPYIADIKALEKICISEKLSP